MTAAWLPATAKWIAASRARETLRPDRLFADPYAEALAGPEGRETMARSESIAGKENAFLPVRTRYFDDLLLAATREIGQVVLLGAGLDTRAYRLPLDAEVRFFELDLPEVFAAKKAILKALHAEPRCHLQYAPARLDGEWTASLRQTAFAPDRPSLWIAEGLLFYLSKAAVHALLSRVRALAAPGSRIAADFSGTGILERSELRSYLSWLASQGAPPPFCCDEPVELFTRAGWKSVKVVEAGQPQANYGRFPPAAGSLPAGKAQTFLVTANV